MTLAILEFSYSKSSTTKNDGYLTNRSFPPTLRELRTSKINLCDNPCYSSMSPMIIRAMATDEEHLVNPA